MWFKPVLDNEDEYVTIHLKLNLIGKIQRYTPITVDPTAPFQTRMT